MNDEFGHQAGDALLAQLAPCWIPELRTTDCLARYGGDEFAMVFPDTTLSRAAEVIERLRLAAPDASFSAGSHRPKSTTTPTLSSHGPTATSTQQKVGATHRRAPHTEPVTPTDE